MKRRQMLLVSVSFLEHHIFDLHQSGLGRTLVLVEFSDDISDLLLRLRDHDMLKRVDPAASLLDLSRHQLAGLLDLSELDEVGQNIGKRLDRVVEVGGTKGEAVGIDVVLVGSTGGVGELRNIHVDLLLGREQSGFERLITHGSFRQNEIGVSVFDALLYPDPQRLVLFDEFEELTHQLVALILEQLMAAGGGIQFFLKLRKLHSGRVDLFDCHDYHLIGEYIICHSEEGNARRGNPPPHTTVNKDKPSYNNINDKGIATVA